MYVLVDQRNQQMPRPRPVGPLLGSSLLNRMDREMPFRAFAIKYVLRGMERYTVNGRSCPVGAGEYLLANAHCTGRITIDSQRPVLGLCADIPHALLDGMSTACLRPEAVEEHAGENLFTGADFPEDRHVGAHTRVGRLMGRLAVDIHREPYAPHTIHQEVYLALAEALHHDHLPLLTGLHRIAAVRPGTRKDIFRRVERGRAFMHDMLHAPIDVSRTARAAAMSEFHFFRAFRAVHGTTPHQYLLGLRLQRARELLCESTHAVSDIAVRCGFMDVAGFSKAFRKHFGMPPTHWRGESGSF